MFNHIYVIYPASSLDSVPNIVELGIPGCNDPIGDMTVLTTLRSCIGLHLINFLGITKIGVFHGLVEGTM